MRALHPIKSACLVFSIQILFSVSLSDSHPLTGSLSDTQTLTGSLSDPHPDSYGVSRGGLNIFDSQVEEPALSEAKGGKGDVNTKNPIKIGLLIQNETSVAAKNGAELAIIKANSKGDRGLKFELVVRSMEGPWGTGSNQAVTLIFDENVIAILGSHDGRNAHLVEQVAAKSRVVFLSAWSGDPTLAQAFVPWYFNCVPNDLQQADALIEEIYNKRKLSDIVLVSDKSYDSESQLNNFLKNVTKQGKAEPLHFLYDSTGTGINDLTEKITNQKTGCVILFLKPPASVKIIEQIKIKRINLPVFGSLELLPGADADYAFDGMNILIEAIRKGGTERENIQKALAEIKFEGVTGTIQFDDKGNRKGKPGFVEIKNGIMVPVK